MTLQFKLLHLQGEDNSGVNSEKFWGGGKIFATSRKKICKFSLLLCEESTKLCWLYSVKKKVKKKKKSLNWWKFLIQSEWMAWKEHFLPRSSGYFWNIIKNCIIPYIGPLRLLFREANYLKTYIVLWRI